MVRADGCVAFDHVQILAVVIAGAVEPGFGTLAGYVDYQRIALPTATVPAHPGWGRRLLLPVHTDDPGGAGELICHQDVGAGSLNDLKRKRQVRRARDAGHVTLEFRIAYIMPLLIDADVGPSPVLKVLSLPGQRFGLVRNFAAFHHALSRRPAAIGAHDFRMWSRLGVVVL